MYTPLEVTAGLMLLKVGLLRPFSRRKGEENKEQERSKRQDGGREEPPPSPLPSLLSLCLRSILYLSLFPHVRISP